MRQVLDVYLSAIRVGQLSSDGGSAHFIYAEDYLARPAAMPLSASLPIGRGRHAQRPTLAFFGGLLPEEGQRQRAAAVLGLSEGNVIGLLDALGGDCAGAVTLLAEGTAFPAVDDAAHPPQPLTDAQLDERLRRAPGDPMVAASGGEFRLSLAGAQAKLPVIWDGERGVAALPRSPRTPTTHILKPASQQFPSLVANEFFCMRLAAEVGLSVAPVERATSSSGLDYLRVARYDRASVDGTTIRLHQEDLCQALGVLTEFKYESEGGPSVVQAMELLRGRSSLAARDLIALWRAVCFNVLIGNCDAHGKNFSLLYAGRGTRLSPLYDLVSTAVYRPPLLDPPLSTRLAMRVGPARDLHQASRDAFGDLAERCGFRRGAMLQQLSELAKVVPAAARALRAQPQHASDDVVASIVAGIDRRAAVLAEG